MRALLLLALLPLAACRGGDDVEMGPGGELLVGGERAAVVEERVVAITGRTLVLDGFAGRIEVVGTERTDGQARLRFERVARGGTERAARERLDAITLTESGDGERFRYEMKAGRPGGAEVNVTAHLPADTRLVVRLETGEVRLDGLRRGVDVRLATGPIRAAGLAGRRVVLTTEAGTIEVTAAALPADAEWRLATRTGTVALSLPPDASARVDARAGTGAVRVDGLDFTDQRLDRPAAGMRFEGRLGDGRARLVLRTDVGAIRLRAASPAPTPATPAPATPAPAPTAPTLPAAPAPAPAR